MSQIKCRVESISTLSETVKKVILTPTANINFKPGQYLKVVLGEGDERPFSIANIHNDEGTVELHIGAAPGNQYALQALDYLENNADDAVIDFPHGEAFLQSDSHQPIILLAGGTGYSYTASLLKGILQQQRHAPTILYWGTRSEHEMYDLESLKALADSEPHFSFIPVIDSPDWNGRQGFVHHAIMDDFPSLADYHVYVAGRFEMAKVVRDDFKEKGLSLDHLFGDAYAFI